MRWDQFDDDDNTFVQLLLERGQMKQARKILLRHGAKRFGQPDAAVVAAVETEESHERLDRWVDRVQDAESWSDLLATP